jgi:hypothetical protein
VGTEHCFDQETLIVGGLNVTVLSSSFGRTP